MPKNMAGASTMNTAAMRSGKWSASMWKEARSAVASRFFSCRPAEEWVESLCVCVDGTELAQ